MINKLGAEHCADGTCFSVFSHHAAEFSLCLFEGEHETQYPMVRSGDIWSIEAKGVCPGQRYGYRADGEWSPQKGLWFDPSKLLVDPYAKELDQRFEFHPDLVVYGQDSAALVPKSIVQPPMTAVPTALPFFQPGGLVYELNVRSFTMLHPDVPEAQRGTISALAHPAIIAHLQKLHVSAIELMPIVAWINERHLLPLGLVNSWGYNPVAMMALDPGLCPGGVAELRETVTALHEAGIGVILDLVFNHNGESDGGGPNLSMRGLDAPSYFRTRGGELINDSGCGNTLACDSPPMRQLILDSLRHFVGSAGIDGFRFDLAPILARTATGFDPASAIFKDIASDPLLASRIMIAEPWDIGPGGYQLGNFPENWLEWNDRYRDDIRKFWRGDDYMVGALASGLTGSSEIFAPPQTRSVNFIAAHDGFTLADCVAYISKHNAANGEHNRDGHNESLSWNNGIEGPTDDQHIIDARRRDLKALLATLFASRGTIMITAGDEFGRSQQGNNNAYCQDNAISWVDWKGRDLELEDHVAQLAKLRATIPALMDLHMLSEGDVTWLSPFGHAFTNAEWHDPDISAVAMQLGDAVTVLINRSDHPVQFVNPANKVAPRSISFVRLSGAEKT